jgi:hypothetical protein
VYINVPDNAVILKKITICIFNPFLYIARGSTAAIGAALGGMTIHDINVSDSENDLSYTPSGEMRSDDSLTSSELSAGSDVEHKDSPNKGFKHNRKSF